MPKNNWEIEFDKKFTYASFTWNFNSDGGEKAAKQTRRNVKSFIRKALSSQLTEVEGILTKYFDKEMESNRGSRLVYEALGNDRSEILTKIKALR